MATLGFVVLWLVFGWLFTIWFVNHFLDNRRFTDGQEIGPVMMIALNVVGPLMAGVMLITLIVDFVGSHSGDAVRRFYGVKD